MMNWTQQANRIKKDARVFYFAFRHPRVGWPAKLVAVCTSGYLFSPIQLIPSFIPVIGFLDDFLVLFLGVVVLRRIVPADVLAECRQRAEADEMSRRDEVRSPAAVVAFVAIVTLWLVAAVFSSALVANYLAR
jgi:uncharacterized membrane protein YkvA (DUF1232 family)